MRSVQWKPSCSTRKDTRTDMTQLIVAFRFIANAPKNNWPNQWNYTYESRRSDRTTLQIRRALGVLDLWHHKLCVCVSVCLSVRPSVRLSVCLSVCHTIRRDAEWRWWNKLLSSNIGSSRTWKHSSGPCHILTRPRCDSADCCHDAWTVSTYRNIIFIINTSQQSGTKCCVYFNFIKLRTIVTKLIFFPTSLRTKKVYFAVKF